MDEISILVGGSSVHGPGEKAVLTLEIGEKIPERKGVGGGVNGSKNREQSQQTE